MLTLLQKGHSRVLVLVALFFGWRSEISESDVIGKLKGLEVNLRSREDKE